MSRETLTAQKRDASGKSPVARRLRQTGQVPGVLYRKGESMAFSVDELEIAAVLRHGTTLVDLEVDGTKHTSVIKDYQVHPVRDTLQHIDLQEVALDETVRSTVDVIVVGEAPGVKAGGVLSLAVHSLNIESTPLNIPETIDIDVSNVDIGDTLHLRDIPAPEGVTILDDPDLTVLVVTVPRGAVAALAAEDAAIAAAKDEESPGGEKKSANETPEEAPKG